jgi:hypothetical protein
MKEKAKRKLEDKLKSGVTSGFKSIKKLEFTKQTNNNLTKLMMEQHISRIRTLISQ